MNRISLIVSLLFITSSALPGCRLQEPVRADAQVWGQLPEEISPWYPIEKNPDAFGLVSGEHQKVSYDPAIMLFFDPAISEPPLDELMDIASETLQVHTESLRYQRDRTEDLQRFRRTAADARLIRDSILNDPDLREFNDKAGEQAAVWFEEDFLPLTHEEERDKIRQAFHTYCEAMILHLAGQDLFLQTEYLQRPTPNALCEGYYKAAGFFSADGDDSSLCEDAVAGRSYDICLWQQGVMKTRWFAGSPADSLLTGLAGGGEGLQILRGIFSTTSTHYERTSRGKTTTYNFGADNFNALLSLTPLRRCESPRWREDLTYEPYCDLFSQTSKTGIDPTPADAINMLHAFNNTTMLLPPWKSIHKTLNGEELTVHLTYNDVLSYFGHHNPQRPAFGNHKFHQPAKGFDYPDPELARAGLAPFRQELEDSFGQILGVVKPDFVDRLRQLDGIIIDADTSRRQIEDGIEWRRQQVFDLAKHTTRLVKTPGVATGYLQFTLHLQRIDQLMQVQFHMGGPSADLPVLEACVQIATNESITCPGSTSKLAPAGLHYHGDKGEIILIIDLDQAETLGFRGDLFGDRQPDDEDIDYFFRADYQKLAGHYLRLAMYPDVMDGVLNYIMGSALIKEDGMDPEDDTIYVHKGSLSAFKSTL